MENVLLLRDFPFLRAQSSAGTLPWPGSAGLLEGRAWQDVLVLPCLRSLTAFTSGRSEAGGEGKQGWAPRGRLILRTLGHLSMRPNYPPIRSLSF